MSGKFFVCEVCGNIAGKVHDSGVHWFAAAVL